MHLTKSVRRSPAGGKKSVGKFGTGQAIRRTEDQRFLTGTGRYTDDITLPDQAYLYLLRSPYAHGRITSFETEDAKNSPGVIAVYTAADLTAAGIKDVVGAPIPASSVSEARDALEEKLTSDTEFALELARSARLVGGLLEVGRGLASCREL